MSGHNHYSQIGKVGGHVVRDMIREMEQRMAAGEYISAAPSNEAEAAQLMQVKQQNQQSSTGGSALS